MIIHGIGSGSGIVNDLLKSAIRQQYILPAYNLAYNKPPEEDITEENRHNVNRDIQYPITMRNRPGDPPYEIQIDKPIEDAALYYENLLNVFDEAENIYVLSAFASKATDMHKATKQIITEGCAVLQKARHILIFMTVNNAIGREFYTLGTTFETDIRQATHTGANILTNTTILYENSGENTSVTVFVII